MAYLQEVPWNGIFKPLPYPIKCLKEGESDTDYNKRVDDARNQIHQRLLVLIHGVVQVGCCLV